MTRKQIWILWIIAIVVIVIASAIGIYSGVQEGKLNSFVADLRDGGYLNNDGKNAIADPSIGMKLTSYSGYISAALSLALVAYGAYKLKVAQNNNETPSAKLFIILTVLSLLALGISIFGAVSSDFGDFFNGSDSEKLAWKGDTSGNTTLLQAVKDKSDSLGIAKINYAELALSSVKFIVTATVAYGASHFKNKQ